MKTVLGLQWVQEKRISPYFYINFICSTTFFSTWISETEAQKNLLESAAEIVQHLNRSLIINQLIFWSFGLTTTDRQTNMDTLLIFPASREWCFTSWSLFL